VGREGSGYDTGDRPRGGRLRSAAVWRMTL
jgi:hypothetical protein